MADPTYNDTIALFQETRNEAVVQLLFAAIREIERGKSNTAAIICQEAERMLRVGNNKLGKDGG